MWSVAEESDSLEERSNGSGRTSELVTTPQPNSEDPRLEIQFTTGESPLGSVLVATTAKGVCAVSLRESEAGAEEYLRARFPKAEIRRDDAPLKRALDTVRDRIAGRNFDDVLPLDLQGTDFQREVWNQLLAIPAGSTRSYLDVAQAINRPKATRAVAQACGANPVAVVVPCHRVVMSDGSIGGYSGLPGVKKALLTAEGALPPSQAQPASGA